MSREEILDFVKKHNLAVIATSNNSGSPEAAVVEFAELNDLTIIIDTLTSSRKYKNLQKNKNVAIVIGWDDDKTVQMDAVATELKGEGLEEAQRVYFAKNPRAKKWATRPDITYFAFRPTWLKYSDVSQKPWLIKELSF